MRILLDENLPKRLKQAFFVLVASSNRIERLSPLAGEILAKLRDARPGITIVGSQK